MDAVHTLTAAAFASLVFSAQASAESPDWKFIEGGYIRTDASDDANGDVNGLDIGGSWSFRDDLVFVRGAYSRQDEDLDSLFSDLELDRYSLGAGLTWSPEDATDVYGLLGYEYWDVELGPFDESDSGYRVAGGVRSVPWGGLELKAEVGYIDVGDIVDGESYFELGSMYTFGFGLGIGASYEEIDDLETLRVTLRYAFR